MKDTVLVQLLAMTHRVRDETQRLADEASKMYEEVVTLAIQIHGDPSVIAHTEEERDE